MVIKNIKETVAVSENILEILKYSHFNPTKEKLSKLMQKYHEDKAKVSEDAWFSLTVPAIPEEMVFRAWIQNALIGKSPSKKRLILSFVITNVLFVIIHLPYYFYHGYPLARMLTEGFGVFVMGSVFGLMFYKSKNILVPIFAHCFVDTISFAFFS